MSVVAFSERSEHNICLFFDLNDKCTCLFSYFSKKCNEVSISVIVLLKRNLSALIFETISSKQIALYAINIKII